MRVRTTLAVVMLLLSMTGCANLGQVKPWKKAIWPILRWVLAPMYLAPVLSNMYTAAGKIRVADMA